MIAIDLFAGAGGFTDGASAAGASVVWAANHWPAAVECHAANHPRTRHACQDLHQIDWHQVPAHDLLLASPACQGHARARGKEREHHDAMRSTAWAVVSCAEVHRPALAVIENVPEFARWNLYPSWSDALRRLGYALSSRVIDAADLGVPQHRRRLFIVASRSKAPLELPEPARRTHRTARQIIDMRGAGWTRWDRLCARTRARIESGLSTIGPQFLVAYYGSADGGRSLDRPIGTITTRDRYGVVSGQFFRMLSVGEYRAAMGFPSTYWLPSCKKVAKHLLGNAVCPPVSRWITEQLVRSA